MNFKNVGAAIAALSLVASAASGATLHDVTIKSVLGEWVDAGPSNAARLNFNDDRSRVNWGKAPSGGKQSGYQFESSITSDVTVSPGTEFDLGVFTHFNNPIYTRPGRGLLAAIEYARLKVDFAVEIGSRAFAFSQFYRFEHDETPNGGNRSGACAHGGQSGAAGVNANGCADRVAAMKNEGLSEDLMVDGVGYSFDISGFRVGDEILSSFLTEERSDNAAVLVGSYTTDVFTRSTPPDLPPGNDETISPVPLPAAGWMLLAGVGGLAALRRRRAKG